MVKTGCDILVEENFKRLKGKRIALLSNQASTDSNLKNIAEIVLQAGVELVSILGPQHGIFAETQANMIEWEGYTHPWLGIPVHPLYGEEMELKEEWLHGAETVVIDLQDAGARPYTYLWTSLIVMKECSKTGIEVIVLDRPNPIGGVEVEGPVLTEGFESFVGLFPLVMRHGLTIGEALGMIKESSGITCSLSIVRMEGWRREMLFDDTKLPWVQPSPNIPTPDSALVYPGTVLLEGTNISEGRGTTRPFEIVGAPWMEPQRFAHELSRFGLEGVRFRPLYFIPTWDKYKGTTCGGVQIHVTERNKFKPVRCGAAIIAAAKKLYPDSFRWTEPPYEYEWKIPPIDIISGSDELRKVVEEGKDIETMFEKWSGEEEEFRKKREPFLLY